MPLPSQGLAALLAIGSVACVLTMAGLGSDSLSAADNENAVQSLSDATVIDAECRTTNTMFGLMFRYGEEHGVHMVDIMPLGKRRQEFEKAYAWRLGTTAHDALCGPLLARYRQAYPDWFSAR